MLYLAIQTFSLLAATAAAFFALGFGFHRKFSRARIVVSDRPPADPPPRHHEAGNDQSAFVAELQKQLLAKERELSAVLERTSAVPPPSVDPALREEMERLRAGMENLTGLNRELEARNRELANRSAFLEQELEEMRFQEPVVTLAASDTENNRENAKELSLELSLKAAAVEEMRVETERLREVLGEANRNLSDLQDTIDNQSNAAAANEDQWRLQREAWEARLVEIQAAHSQTLAQNLTLRQTVDQLEEEARQKPKFDLANRAAVAEQEAAKPSCRAWSTP